MARGGCANGVGSVRGKETSVGYMSAAARQVDCVIGYAGANGVGIACFAGQLQVQRIMFFADVVAQQERSGVIVGNQHVEAAVIIEIADSQAARGKLPGKNRTALRAYVL